MRRAARGRGRSGAPHTAGYHRPVSGAAQPRLHLDRSLTDERVAASYNNFYEFTTDKKEVRNLVDNFRIRPWQLEVKGLVENPRVYDVDNLVRRLPLEERLYRFRCVEASAEYDFWANVRPGGTAPALVPGQRAPHRHRRTGAYPALQRLRRIRGRPLQKNLRCRTLFPAPGHPVGTLLVFVFTGR